MLDDNDPTLQNHNSLQKTFKTIAKVAAAGALLSSPFTTYWLLILTGVIRYDANLLAHQKTDLGQYDSIPCNDVNNSDSFQHWESKTALLYIVNFACSSVATLSQLQRTLETICNQFKSDHTCNYPNRHQLKNIDFCNITDHPYAVKLARLACQIPNAGDQAMMHIGPFMMAITLTCIGVLTWYAINMCRDHKNNVELTGRYSTFENLENPTGRSPQSRASTPIGDNTGATLAS